MQEKLRTASVETLAIVNTPLARARQYFEYRPTRLLLAADPDLTTHRLFGLPKPELTPELMQAAKAVRINPTGELPEPLPPFVADEALNRQDGFQLTQVDEQILAANGTQLTGHFLIDREAIVRWQHVEASEGLAELAKFPTEVEILMVARALPT